MSEITIEVRKKLIGERLKILRESYKLTQEDVAKIIGIKQNTYSEYESGKRIMKTDSLVKLSYLFKFPADYIIMPEKYPLDRFGDLEELSQDMRLMIKATLEMPKSAIKMDILASLATLNLGVETLKEYNENKTKQ